IVFYRAGSKIAGINKGSYAEVQSIDTSNNTITAKINERTEVYDPKRLKGVEIYYKEDRSFSAGDRIQLTHAIHAQRIANGDLGSIISIDHSERTATVQFDDDRSQKISLSN